MSSKNIKRWITINGNHVPVYEDGTLGGVAEKFTSYDGEEHEFHAEKATGKTVSDLKDDLKKNYGLEIDSADADDMERSKSFNDEKVTMYDEDGNEYEGTYNKYSDGGREIVDIKKKEETGQEGGLSDEEMKKYIVDTPIKDDPDYDRKRKERELADEADAYDRAHGEGRYADMDDEEVYERSREAREKYERTIERRREAEKLVKEASPENKEMAQRSLERIKRIEDERKHKAMEVAREADDRKEKSIKVGDKEVGVSKTKPASSESYDKANAAYKRSEARSQKAELTKAKETGDYSGIFASTYNKMSLSEVKNIGRQLGLSDFALSGNKSQIIADILRIKRKK